MFFKKDLVLGQEYLAFLLLNLFDLFLTGWIFKHHGMEANVVANWVLSNPHLGLRGFAVFKFLMVVFIIVICEVIAVASVPKARIVITTGCLVYLLVIGWEAYQIFTNIDIPDTVGPITRHHLNQESLLLIRQWSFGGKVVLLQSIAPNAFQNGA
jgi:hypothetical protein